MQVVGEQPVDSCKHCNNIIICQQIATPTSETKFARFVLSLKGRQHTSQAALAVLIQATRCTRLQFLNSSFPSSSSTPLPRYIIFFLFVFSFLPPSSFLFLFLSLLFYFFCSFLFSYFIYSLSFLLYTLLSPSWCRYGNTLDLYSGGNLFECWPGQVCTTLIIQLYFSHAGRELGQVLETEHPPIPTLQIPICSPFLNILPFHSTVCNYCSGNIVK